MSRATVSERSISAEIPGALLLIYGLSALAYLTIASWSSPILDMFGFRQAQTAISAYWIAKGGPLFAYQTPVFGYPWSIPFEFPLYQWLVALLADSSGLSLDQGGSSALHFSSQLQPPFISWFCASRVIAPFPWLAPEFL